MSASIEQVILPVASSILVMYLTTSISHYITSTKANKAEANQIDKEVEQIKEIVEKENNSILDLMYKNVLELREYYVTSKRQANSSFYASLIACFLGALIYTSGIVITIFVDGNVAILSTVAGSVVEVISGLFFWIHNKSIEQLNIYHQRLGTTEKYLISIQLIDNISEEKKMIIIDF